MLTKSELEVMNLLWDTDHPLTSSEIVNDSKNRTWKKTYINILIKSLLQKEMIRVAGMKQMVKNYARTFEPTVTREVYNITQISEQPGFNQKDIPLLFSHLVSITDDMETIQELEDILNKRKSEIK